MRILFDTNVVLDLLLDREPFSANAKQLIAKVERGELHGMLCATTVTTIHYLLHKALGKDKAVKTIGMLLKLFEVANVTRTVLQDALDADDKDYEDAVLYKAAYHSGADMIVTRDRSGFAKADIPVMNPQEMLALIASTK
ncbi:MAG: PIN domain-containing protein [Sulfurovum sp.]|nr:PIN domain-containing protein [Sulfurovum sp.]